MERALNGRVLGPKNCLESAQLKSAQLQRMSTFAIDLECIKRGWLHKKGEAKSSAFRHRFFVLSKTHLHYYKAVDEKAPAGSIAIAGASVQPVQKWRLHIQPRNTYRVYVIAAADEHERDEWIADIQAAAEGGLQRSHRLPPGGPPDCPFPAQAVTHAPTLPTN